MNLRTTRDQLRFRISQEELTLLCSGNSLEQTTPFPNSRALRISICPISDAAGPLHIDLENDHIILCVDAAAADALLESLPKRDGLNTQQLLIDGQSLELQLEVDIRSQMRKRSSSDSEADHAL